MPAFELRSFCLKRDLTDAHCKEGFKLYLDTLRRIAPKARLIWAATAPIKKDLAPRFD